MSIDIEHPEPTQGLSDTIIALAESSDNENTELAIYREALVIAEHHLRGDNNALKDIAQSVKKVIEDPLVHTEDDMRELELWCNVTHKLNG